MLGFFTVGASRTNNPRFLGIVTWKGTNLMKVRARNIFGSVAVGALACSAMIAAPAFAAPSGITVGNGSTVERVQGIDRFATAVAASKAFDAERGNTVIVANYLGWADIIAATPLAAKDGANVLYSYAGKLENRTKAELVRLAGLGVQNVLFIGGEGVLTNALATEVEGLTKADGTSAGLTVDRIGGVDRYETALLLAAETNDAGAIATARGDVADNKAAQDEVNAANAALKAAVDAVAKTTTAYIQAETNLLTASTQRAAEVAKLKTVLTQAQADALKADITAKNNDLIVAVNALNTVLKDTAATPAQVEAAQTAVTDARKAFADAQKAYEDAATDPSVNDATWKAIDAIDARINGTKGLQAVQTAAVAARDAAVTALTPAQARFAAAPGVAQTAIAAAAGVQKAYTDAVDAAIKLGAGDEAFLATGSNFADALAAGPAAAKTGGVVLLTNGSTVPASTQRYLDAKPEVVAVGGDAAQAVKADAEFVGADRYETAAKVAAAYQGGDLALASGTVAADAVIAGALLGNVGGAVVLTAPDALPSATKGFFSYDYTSDRVLVFGGTGAVSTHVLEQVKTAIGG